MRGPFGISGEEMTYKCFLRSLFLAITEGTSVTEGHFPQVVVATAKSHVQNESHEYIARMKMTFRFHTVAHQPIEICFESSHFTY
jgi:hypothetical protein